MGTTRACETARVCDAAQKTVVGTVDASGCACDVIMSWLCES